MTEIRELKETELEAPFGKRFLDQSAIRKFKGITRFKFWTIFGVLVAEAFCFLLIPSNRVERFSSRPVQFADIRHAGDLDNVEVPQLIVVQKREIDLSSFYKTRWTPISVVSFTDGKNIPPGSEAKAILLTGATNGLIKAKLVENVKVDGTTLLDAGALLLGLGHSTEERLFVQFQKVVFRDGTFIKVSAQAYDLSDLVVGLKGSRVGDMGLKLAASSGLHFLSGMATGLQSPPIDENGRPKKPTVQDAALNGVSEAASERAKAYMEEIKQKPPIIEVKAGTKFLITFDGGSGE